MAPRLRLADLLAGLSIASDLGFGLPPETAMRSCLVATRLARLHGLPEDEVRDTFYASVLVHSGCPGFSHETSVLYGDELAVTRAAARTNLADPADWEASLLPALTRGRAGRRSTEELLREGEEFGGRYDTASCEVASSLARRIDLGPGVQRALYELGEWWSGDGVPQGLSEDAISASARVVRAAADAAVLHDLGGREHAVAGLRARSGTLLDPSVVATFVAHAEEILASDGDPRTHILEEEPEPVVEHAADEVRTVAAAFGNVADLKFPLLQGHSHGVAALAVDAATRLRFDARSIRDLEVAAHLHDLGRLAISNLVWEKRGPLTSAQWEQVRLHPYHSERILASSEALEGLRRIAGMHHERLDGSGYHRGSAAREQPASVRVLVAADAFDAMTHDRPHRGRLSPDEAREELLREARAGLFDAACVAAVLEAAGQEGPRPRDLRPAGLTARELDVVRLVARGFSNPDIANELVISRRTAEHHVQNVYAKVGVSSRPALALFAMEHDLL